MQPSWRRTWLTPIVALMGAAVVAFGALYALDAYVTGGPASDAPVGILKYVYFDQGSITDAVSALGSMVAAVLGIVITVVSIVVQLSAGRYTGVAAMFFRDRTNLVVMGFYIVACVAGVCVSLSVRTDFVPRATILGMMVTTALCLAVMAPYFGYVFWFLEPTNIVARISRQAVDIAKRGIGASPSRLAFAQAEALGAMEELTDITTNSISGKDKIIASRAVDALKDLAVQYIPLKEKAEEAWFTIGAEIRENPDFVAMDPESLQDLAGKRTWFEWKVLRQYLGIYNEALGQMRDINYLIAIDTRYIGEAAAAAKDDELITLAFRFMNSYLRATLNARDVRTAYNVLNQYRLLVESMLKAGFEQAAITAVGHMKYYGHVSYDMKIPFVTETVAFDVGTLCQVAHDLQAKVAEDAILHAFLDLDRPVPERSQEQALKGVRKAQVKLAAYYLTVGEEPKARIIQDDMAVEPHERLRAIKEELEKVETKDFWEIIDRGRNFEWMPAAQKERMREFFTWFGDGLSPISSKRVTTLTNE